MERTRRFLLVPDCFVVAPPKPPQPPPMPGTVEPEDLRPDPLPPLPFLVPWKKFFLRSRLDRSISIPCEIDFAALEKYHERYMTADAVRSFFKDRPEVADLTAQVTRSLGNPFCANQPLPLETEMLMAERNTEEEPVPLVWHFGERLMPNPTMESQLGGKKLKHRHHRVLQGIPWSVQSFGTYSNGPARNMVYDDRGNAVAQVDFGHFGRIGTHAHALVVDNLEHTPGDQEDHMIEFERVPWFWMCVPDMREDRPGGAFEGAAAGGGGKDDAEDGGSDEEEGSSNSRLRGVQGVPSTGDIDGYAGWVRINISNDDFRQLSM